MSWILFLQIVLLVLVIEIITAVIISSFKLTVIKAKSQVILPIIEALAEYLADNLDIEIEDIDE